MKYFYSRSAGLQGLQVSRSRSPGLQASWSSRPPVFQGRQVSRSLGAQVPWAPGLHGLHVLRSLSLLVSRRPGLLVSWSQGLQFFKAVRSPGLEVSKSPGLKVSQPPWSPGPGSSPGLLSSSRDRTRFLWLVGADHHGDGDSMRLLQVGRCRDQISVFSRCRDNMTFLPSLLLSSFLPPSFPPPGDGEDDDDSLRLKSRVPSRHMRSISLFFCSG